MKKVILFQGDSITDAGRNYQDGTSLGLGYPYFVSAQMGCEHPDEYTFWNRGISGNRIVDVYARIKADILNLKPDYMSILIGVNDVWHEIEVQNGVSDEKFEKFYCMLIEEILEELPDIKIMIMEPFVLEASATSSTPDQPERWSTFNAGVRAKAAIARRVAEKYNLAFMELQDKLDKLCETAPASYWLGDGVHPTHIGHHFLKNEWLKKFEEIK